MNNMVIDLEDVLERVQNDWELLFELFDIFEQDFIAKKPVCDDLCARQELDKLRDIAHSLKGAAGNISAKKLFESFYQIERLSEERTPERIPSILKAVDKQFIEFQAEKQQLKKQHSP